MHRYTSLYILLPFIYLFNDSIYKKFLVVIMYAPSLFNLLEPIFGDRTSNRNPFNHCNSAYTKNKLFQHKVKLNQV